MSSVYMVHKFVPYDKGLYCPNCALPEEKAPGCVPYIPETAVAAPDAGISMASNALPVVAQAPLVHSLTSALHNRSNITNALPFSVFSVGQSLFMIRPCYSDLYTRVLEYMQHEKQHPRVCIYGTAGNGKSVFTLYFLLRYTLEHPSAPVVYCDVKAGPHRYLIKGSVVQVVDKAYNDSDCLLLWDGSSTSAAGSTLAILNQRVLNLYSPRAITTTAANEVRKGGRQWVMPVWSLPEMIALSLFRMQNDLSVNNWVERFTVFGGVPRLVFDVDWALSTIVPNVDIVKLLRLRGEASDLTEQTELIHLCCDDEYRFTRTQLASLNVVEAVCERYKKMAIGRAQSKVLERALLEGGPIATQVFERLALSMLQAGGTWTIRHLPKDGQGQAAGPAQQLHTIAPPAIVEQQPLTLALVQSLVPSHSSLPASCIPNALSDFPNAPMDVDDAKSPYADALAVQEFQKRISAAPDILNNTFPIVTPPQSICFYKASDLETLPNGRIARPFTKTFGAIDAICLPRDLIQCTVTVSPHHVEIEEDLNRLKEVCKMRSANRGTAPPPFRLIFVVPNSIAHLYQLQPYRCGTKGYSNNCADNDPEVDQFVLGVDLSPNLHVPAPSSI